MMQFPILLLSIILSVQALDVYVGFDSLSSAPGTYGVYIEPTYGDEWVPTSFNFTLRVDVQAPSPTDWTYSINDVSIAKGTEDFCNPTPMTPGGIAIQILLSGIGFNDKECPLQRYTKTIDLPWTWAEAQSLDLKDIFDAAATILAGGSLDPDVSIDVAVNPPPEPVSGGMKRRRRDSSTVSVQLDILNDFIDARLILSAEV